MITGSRIFTGTAVPPRVYLHYLDRELLEAIGWAPTTKELRRFTNTLTLSLDSPLICSYPHLWESFDYIAPIIPELRMLHRYRILDAVSSQKYFRDFRASRHELFAHTADRYQVYFRDPPEDLLTISPGVFKPSDTTKFLLKKLPDLTRLRGHNAIADHVSVAGDEKLLLNEIESVISERGDRAITYALFESRLVATAGPTAAKATRLRISELYTAHYLASVSGDVPTGVTGLTFFDGLSETFPQLDLRILAQVMQLVGLEPILDRPVTQDVWWESFLTLRGSPSHVLLVDLIQQVVSAIVATAPAEDRSTSDACRDYCVSRLLRCTKVARLVGRNVEEQLLHMSEHLRLILAELGAKYIPDLGKMMLAAPSQAARVGRVLLLTANEIETSAIEGELADGPLVPIHSDNFSFFDLGEIGHNKVVCAQIRPRAEDLQSIVMSAAQIIQELKPSSVIAVGAALKLHPSKAGSTNVLLSAQIGSYDTSRDNSLNLTEYAERLSSPAWLLATARSAARRCEGTIAHTGLLMCGPDFQDGARLRDLLLDSCPDAMAAEVFGSGILACERAYKCNWLVIKGECGWDGARKMSSLERAAKTAARVVLQMLLQRAC